MELSKAELKTALISGRKQLIKLVEEVSEEQLQHQSLCTGWSNKNVLGHIIGFELSGFDAFLLFFRLRDLDEINERQAKKYSELSKDAYPRLLRRGLKRTLLLLSWVPSNLLNKKFIRVPNGRLSIAQLMGDLIMNRAIHYLDIAAPLGIASKVTDPSVMNASVKFVLACIDLLNPKIPKKYYGQTIKLELTGLSAGMYYWKIGTSEVAATKDEESKLVLTAKGHTNDLLFTVSVRPTLLRHQLAVTGDRELEKIVRKTFNANALWEP